VAGTGPTAKIGDVVFMNYKGKLAADGTVFDESRDIPLPVEGIFPEGTPFPIEEGASIPGFFEGLQQVQKGGKYTLFIPSDKAYGAAPPQGAPIPPNADLEFELEVIEIMSRATFERNLGILQQAMQSQQGGGAPGGAPQAAPGQGQ
jgi:FKBP-type peptidyl-prolyl cis-trans isomerase FkpA